MLGPVNNLVLSRLLLGMLHPEVDITEILPGAPPVRPGGPPNSPPGQGRRRRSWLLALAALLGLSACAPPLAHTTARYVLIDTSSAYHAQIPAVQAVALSLLKRLQPGDTVTFARIGPASFTQQDIIARLTLSDSPSLADEQRIALARTLRRFLQQARGGSRHADLTGALLQGIELLNETHPAARQILICSPLRQDPPRGYLRDGLALNFKGIDVVALNVVKLAQDNRDPRRYLARLAAWGSRVQGTGGRWQVVNDLDQLEAVIL